jgi:hypothetical protein
MVEKCELVNLLVVMRLRKMEKKRIMGDSLTTM